jgi:hypothetical protein
VRWLRLYTDILDDEKISFKKSNHELFHGFILLLAYAAELENDGKIDKKLSEISWRTRIPEARLNKIFDALQERKIVENIESNTMGNSLIIFKNWGKRQYKSDDITARVNKHRNVSRNVSCNDGRNVVCNIPDTETESETDTDTETEKDTANVLFICEKLVEKVKKFRPNHKQGKPEKEQKIIALMLRRDKRDPDKTLLLVDWYPIGKKYIPEIYSATALREKWDKLDVAYEREHQSQKQNNITPPDIAECKKSIIRFTSGDYGCDEKGSCPNSWNGNCLEKKAVDAILSEKGLA